MAELIANCPRCGAQKMTFDLYHDNYVGAEYGWQRFFESFCVCRGCGKSTVFVLSLKDVSAEDFTPVKCSEAVNDQFKIENFVSLKDMASKAPPEHLPPEIEAAFREGATCLALCCFNAAGTMFRLCVDIASRSKLPADGVSGMTPEMRRSLLGRRLAWLFDKGLLPADLKRLANCIREHGNDGAHAGSLTKEDAEDLCDFAVALLSRLYTEPERLRLAERRRDDRRSGPAKKAGQG